ncbi:hypothetical protein FNH22_28415 [Fulvivirga sp. M361]|uniref:STN domain-containing protein n=1 Tax=Fulvivirga sp. M361 TaxID=2594266 RepID=UPI00117A96EB|nr:STN domain-containing protein [Fulvivirga sp. M361]TRX48813.1 hypothetical protein FNH22_28415 [Fulvivirga sp. M361]
MDVNRRIIFVFSFSFFCFNAKAQVKQNSFSFHEESYPKILQVISDAYELYLSYDPKIFDGEPTVTVKFTDKTVYEVLDQLLGDKFHYKIIQDYVVIKKSIVPEVEAEAEPSQLTPVAANPVYLPTVYDTIRYEKIIVKYDTQVVIQEKVFYDTVRIEKVQVVYDTVQVSTEIRQPEKPWQFIPYLTPNLWMRRNGNSNTDYRGLGFGLMGRYSLNNLRFHAGVEYNYSVNNVSFTRSETISQQSIDTVSTFFIIEDGVRVPVYVVDTTEVETEVNQKVDRQNSFQSLSFFVGAGYFLEIGKVSIGAELGFLASSIIDGDEVFNFSNGEITGNLDYQSPQLNVSLNLPVIIRQGDFERFEVVPYLRFGLGPDFKPPLKSNDRYVLGVRLGIIL